MINLKFLELQMIEWNACSNQWIPDIIIDIIAKELINFHDFLIVKKLFNVLNIKFEMHGLPIKLASVKMIILIFLVMAKFILLNFSIMCLDGFGVSLVNIVPMNSSSWSIIEMCIKRRCKPMLLINGINFVNESSIFLFTTIIANKMKCTKNVILGSGIKNLITFTKTNPEDHTKTWFEVLIFM